MTVISLKSRADISIALQASIDSGGLLLDESALGPEFFAADGFAREVVQKFASYRARLAIVVRDPARHGAAFTDLGRELRAHAQVRCFDSHQLARQWLAHLPVKKC